MNTIKKATKRSVIFSYIALLALLVAGYGTAYRVAKNFQILNDRLAKFESLTNEKLTKVDSDFLSYVSNFHTYQKDMEIFHTSILSENNIVKKKLESIEIEPISEADMMLIRSSVAESSSVRVINNE